MALELSMLVPHVPRICFEDRAPPFQRTLIQGLNEASKELFHQDPEIVVIVSCHFPTTFHHYVNSAPRHAGLLTAVECPDMIADVPYNYPGDSELAEQLTDAGKKNGLPVLSFHDSSYVWDYGTLVPMRYLVPKENVPVIGLSVCLAASLDETFEWGRVIGKTLAGSSRRAVFVSSGALSHNLVRGAEVMPSLSEQALDKRFTNYLLTHQFNNARNMLPQYSRIAGVESGGRHLSMLLGVMEASGNYSTRHHGYAQSSGSGNAIMTFHRQ